MPSPLMPIVPTRTPFLKSGTPPAKIIRPAPTVISFGIGEQLNRSPLGGVPPVRRRTSAGLTSASCSPVVNGLKILTGYDNGPFGVLGIPYGKNGRARKPIPRLVIAIEPLSGKPKLVVRPMYLATLDPGTMLVTFGSAARNCAWAFAILKNNELRAF